MKKLNLGCGFKKLDGFINIDVSEGCEADLVLDLCQEKWPFEDSSIDEIKIDYALEEMGQSPEDLGFVIKEMFRVAKNGATVSLQFSFPRHDDFVMNPLSHHALSPQFFATLSMSNNLQQIANGVHYNCLAMNWGVNFEVTHQKLLIDEMFEEDLSSGNLKEEQLRQMLQFNNNVCRAVELQLQVVKKQES